MTNIILVNDDIQDKEKISSIISSQEDLAILGTGDDTYDAITLVRKHKPDIVLLDAAVFNERMEIYSTLKRYSPDSAIVVFCSDVKDFLVQGIVKGILTDCLIKEFDMAQLAIILRRIHQGEHYVNSRIIARAFQILADYYSGKKTGLKVPETASSEEKNDHCRADFSNTELEILRYITRGYNSKEIAKALYLKTGTIRNYISSIMQKAGVESRTQIILYAQECGFVKEGQKPAAEKKFTEVKNQLPKNRLARAEN